MRQPGALRAKEFKNIGPGRTYSRGRYAPRGDSGQPKEAQHRGDFWQCGRVGSLPSHITHLPLFTCWEDGKEVQSAPGERLGVSLVQCLRQHRKLLSLGPRGWEAVCRLPGKQPRAMLPSPREVAASGRTGDASWARAAAQDTPALGHLERKTSCTRGGRAGRGEVLAAGSSRRCSRSADTSGEVTSSAPTTGRSLRPFHMLSGPSPALNNPKAISNKPGTGNKIGMRLGWREGIEKHSKNPGLKQRSRDQLFWAGVSHPPPGCFPTC